MECVVCVCACACVCACRCVNGVVAETDAVCVGGVSHSSACHTLYLRGAAVRSSSPSIPEHHPFTTRASRHCVVHLTKRVRAVSLPDASSRTGARVL